MACQPFKSDFVFTNIRFEVGAESIAWNAPIASLWVIVNAVGLHCAWLVLSEAKLG